MVVEGCLLNESGFSFFITVEQVGPAVRREPGRFKTKVMSWEKLKETNEELEKLIKGMSVDFALLVIVAILLAGAILGLVIWF